MVETIDLLSLIKKTCHQLHQLACSFEEFFFNVTHQMWVTFTLSKSV